MIIDLVVTGAVSLFFDRTVAEYVTFQLIKNTGIDISDVEWLLQAFGWEVLHYLSF